MPPALEKPNPTAIELHEKVAIAVRNGDPAAAEQAMRAIIDEAAEALASADDPPDGDTDW